MTPSKVASQLKIIASKIQGSKNPSRQLVAADLKLLLAAITKPAPPKPFSTMTDAEFEAWRSTLPDEDGLNVGDITVHFNVTPGSSLDTDDNGKIGIPFTNLLETVVQDVEWGRTGLSFTIPRGWENFSTLAVEIQNGAHGPDMKKALESLENPGSISGSGSSEFEPENEYWI